MELYHSVKQRLMPITEARKQGQSRNEALKDSCWNMSNLLPTFKMEDLNALLDLNEKWKQNQNGGK